MASASCDTCGTKAGIGDRFCAACGNPLSGYACAGCGGSVPSGSIYCPHCGVGLNSGRAANDAGAIAGPDQRLITVLCCDLVSSVAILRTLPVDEQRHLLLELYQRPCVALAESFGGMVGRIEGDAIQAHFGRPVAQEDAAIRAVECALRLREHVRSVEFDSRQGHRVKLAIRVGIASGVLLTGDELMLGGGLQRPVYGEAVNLAARLQQSTAKDTIAVSDLTRSLAGPGFLFEALRGSPLKGFGPQQTAWRVAGRTARLPATQPTEREGIIDRHTERARLARAWGQACQGEGSVTLLVGEAGIGKTRLAMDLVHAASKPPARVLHMACADLWRTSPLRPFERSFAANLPDAGPDAGDRVAEAANDPCFSPFKALLEESLRGSPDDQATDRLVLLRECFGHCLRARRNPAPLLIVVEDLHWADAATLALLQGVARDVPALSVMLLITTRGEHAQAFTGAPRCEALTLSRLDADDSVSLVQATAGDKALPPKLVGDLLANGNGVPLAIRELTLSVLQGGALEEVGEHWVWTSTSPMAEVPLTLQARFEARLDAVPPARRTLALASVLGSGFTLNELLGTASALGVPHAAIVSGLEAALAAGILERAPGTRHAEFSFSHALMERTAYGRLLPEERARLHAAVVRSHDAAHANPRHELAATHLQRAGRYLDAALRWEQAARETAKRNFFDMACAHLRLALAALARLAENDETRDAELRMRTLLGDQLIAARGWSADEAGTNYLRVAELARACGKAAAGFHARFGLFNFHLIRGEIATADRVASELLNSEGSPAQRCRAMRAAGASALHAGRLEAAAGHLREALEAAPAVDEVDEEEAGAVYSGGVVARSLLMWTSWFRGQLDDAQRLHRSLALNGFDIDSPFSRAYAHGLCASTWQCRQEPEKTLEHVKACDAAARKHGMRFWHARSLLLEGWATARLDNAKQGVTLIEQGIHQYASLGAEQLLPYGYAMLAEVLLAVGDGRRATDACRAGLSKVKSRGLGLYESELLRLSGLASLRTSSDPDAAAGFFERALQCACTRQMPFLVLRTVRSVLDHEVRVGRDPARLERWRDDALARVGRWRREPDVRRVLDVSGRA